MEKYFKYMDLKVKIIRSKKEKNNNNCIDPNFTTHSPKICKKNQTMSGNICEIIFFFHG